MHVHTHSGREGGREGGRETVRQEDRQRDRQRQEGGGVTYLVFPILETIFSIFLWLASSMVTSCGIVPEPCAMCVRARARVCVFFLFP